MHKFSTTLAAKIWAIINSKIIINSINLLVQIKMLPKNLFHNPNILANHLLNVLHNYNCLHIRSYSNNPTWILWILNLYYLQRAACNFKDVTNFILSGFWDWNYYKGISWFFSEGSWNNLWYSLYIMDSWAQNVILWLVIIP